MDIMVVIGFVVAFFSFYYGVPELREEIDIYVQPGSFILVFGGTIASTLISSSVKEVRSILIIFKQLLLTPRYLKPQDAIRYLVAIAEKAQSVSKAQLASEGKGLDDGFMERAMSLVAAGLDKDFIRRTLETDIAEIERRHALMTGIIRSMGTYAPMFGMLGTVLGVTQVLKNVTDIQNIVSGMSLALLTTLYGLILSAIFFIPTANKLKGKSKRELLTKTIIVEGISMILDKEIPLKVEKYLTAYMETKYKKSSDEE